MTDGTEMPDEIEGNVVAEYIKRGIAVPQKGLSDASSTEEKDELKG